MDECLNKYPYFLIYHSGYIISNDDTDNEDNNKPKKFKLLIVKDRSKEKHIESIKKDKIHPKEGQRKLGL